ncbi:uroporphyrinogen-III synthase [Altererythrobacter xixiisoli]|uniref:Uroporphyrinogen-III synthase n=1 Tax=Croceibacterium xixiisoli TaxID=1476466 RepID=A0A6I4TVV7_9SPHN|nr:uroporphyrinogen-III synthase [Croceibacterium xixiisoli]MXO99251.1 uroporphyrinogen-III synthase [Croceibacterium xixiisoli]
MTTLWVIRPQPGCADTVAAARALGLTAQALPLFHIGARDWQPPDPGEIDGLLLGSANALRHAGDAIHRFAGKPAWCVGQATADAARAAGLTVAAIGVGGLQQVLDACPPSLHLLRLAGEDHIDLIVPPAIRITTRIVYGSQALSLNGHAAAQIGAGAVVALHSAQAARHLARECDRLGLPRSAVALVALGPRIAAAAGPGWAAVRAADHPRDAALLALARQMCHDAAARHSDPG